MLRASVLSGNWYVQCTSAFTMVNSIKKTYVRRYFNTSSVRHLLQRDNLIVYDEVRSIDSTNTNKDDNDDDDTKIRLL